MNHFRTLKGGNAGGKCEGFALISAMVFVVLAFAIAGGLAVSRQIWGFSSAKQLDLASTDLASRVDSSRWLSALRYQVQNAGVSYGSVNTASVTLPFTASYGVDSYSISGAQMFGPAGSYPAVESVDVSAPVLFQSGSLSVVSSGLDPFRGLSSNARSFGVSFAQEMTEVGRSIRATRFDSTASQLRAWGSMDGSMEGVVNLRQVPLSVFTLFCPEAADGSALNLSNSWLLGGSAAYNYPVASPSYTSVAGVGRVYVEGKVSMGSDLRLGVPLVATRGLVYPCQTFFGVLPNSSTAFSVNPLTYADYLKARARSLGGMVVTGEDGPCRLLRAGETLSGNRWGFAAGSLSNTASGFGNALYSAAARIRVSVPSATVVLAGYNGTRFSGGVAGDVTKITSASVWTVNAVGKEVVFAPGAGFFDLFGIAPNVMEVEVVNDSDGSVASDYKIRIQIPSVANLSAVASKRKWTLYCPRQPVILEDGFNRTGTDKGTMVVAPVVYALGSSPSAGNQSHSIAGVIVTEAYDPRAPFWGTQGSDVVNLSGSLIIWNRLSSSPAGPMMAVKITPDVDYMSGEVKVPEVVPGGLDIRWGSRRFQLYQIKKVVGSGTEETGGVDH